MSGSNSGNNDEKKSADDKIWYRERGWPKPSNFFLSFFGPILERSWRRNRAKSDIKRSGMSAAVFGWMFLISLYKGEHTDAPTQRTLWWDHYRLQRILQFLIYLVHVVRSCPVGQYTWTPQPMLCVVVFGVCVVYRRNMLWNCIAGCENRRRVRDRDTESEQSLLLLINTIPLIFFGRDMNDCAGTAVLFCVTFLLPASQHTHHKYLLQKMNVGR